MPFGNIERVLALDRPDDELSLLLTERGGDHFAVRGAADPVEDATCDSYIGIELPQAEQDRAGGAGHSVRIEDDQDGQAEQLRDCGGAPVLGAVLTVVESAHRLDHRDVGIARPAAKGAPHSIVSHHP